jgi:hypothetical protein
VQLFRRRMAQRGGRGEVGHHHHPGWVYNWAMVLICVQDAGDWGLAKAVSMGTFQ